MTWFVCVGSYCGIVQSKTFYRIRVYGLFVGASPSDKYRVSTRSRLSVRCHRTIAHLRRYRPDYNVPCSGRSRVVWAARAGYESFVIGKPRKLVRRAYCGPLSETTVSGMPFRAKMGFMCRFISDDIVSASWRSLLMLDQHRQPRACQDY